MIRRGRASVVIAAVILLSAVSLPTQVRANGDDAKKGASVAQKQAAVPMPRPRGKAMRQYRVAAGQSAPSAYRPCSHLGCRGFVVHGIQY